MKGEDMEKAKNRKDSTQKKVKTKGTVQIPGGLKEVIMGTSKELAQRNKK